LAEIRRRHESLRTTFGAVDGRPVQLIGPPGELPLPLTDLSGLDPAAARTELGQRAVEEAQRPFDLAHGPLLRTHLFRLGDLEHVLVVSAHHIVADGWSFSILLRELADLYPAFARDRSSPLAEISIQYADYADWQRRSMDDSALRSSLSYWQRTLADAPTLELPTDRPRPARQTFRGAAVPRALSPELSDGLRALGLAERATLFMTLLAAFKALLARHAGCEDVVVGAPVAGRTRAETEPLIGFFLNTLALRDDLSGDPSFRELLGRVRSTVVEALANQDVPFEKVLEALRPDRDLSRTPLFQVFFNVLNFPRQISPEGSELGISPLTPDLRSLALDLPAKFDLSLYASELPDGIGLLLLYNADLFEASTATTLMRHFEVLLTAAVRAPNTPLSALPLVSDAERAAAIIRPSRPFVLFPPPDRLGSIPERFRAIVAQHADRVAVESRGTSWTYRELDAMARGISRAVQAAAGGDGARVGLLLEHDAPMVAAVLGVLDSGNAYVPLDPRYPRERLAFMVADAESGVLVTSTRNLELARSLAAASVPIVNVDEVEAAQAGPRQAWPHPDAMAYILYTSGSTGQPKGVVQSHRNVLHHIEVYTNNLHIASEDRLALLASFSFDAAVMDVFGALLNGATLCLRDVREEGVEGLADWLGRERITIYHSTPTLYRAVLLDLPETRTFPHVRLVVLGGEEAVRRDVELYRRHFTTDCLFVNGLGPTESTVSFQHFIDHQTPLAGWSVPVGGAVSETELVLLDPNGRPTTLGGEIGIRSPYVAFGYWRQPELTAAAFRPDPEGGARRIYRTGDLGRLRPDGTLEFLGRRDDQVKVRGVRIEPAEVESAIDAHPGVRRSVVVARDDGEGHYLAAYVIPRTDPAPTVSALLGYARERLPASMVPSVFVTLDAVPLTPSGKVDRRALPVPDRADRARRSAPVAPRTAVEIAVAAIWSEVLGVEAVGTEDNFFELGGHSLMATRVLSRLRAQLHVDIPLRALFEGPTVAALATLVEAQRGAHAVVAEREEIEL
jgi:amino acid adenylation domain-containing protein